MAQAGVVSNTGLEQQYDSTLEETFKNARLFVFVLPPHRCGTLVAFTRNGPMYVVLSSLQIVMQNGSYVRTGAFEVNREEFGLSPKDQTCHYETWVRFCHVRTPLGQRERERAHDHSRPGSAKRRRCKYYTHSVRLHTRKFFSSVWLKIDCSILCASSLEQSFRIDTPRTAQNPSIVSSLLFTSTRTPSAAPLFGRFAERSFSQIVSPTFRMM